MESKETVFDDIKKELISNILSAQGKAVDLLIAISSSASLGIGLTPKKLIVASSFLESFNQEESIFNKCIFFHYLNNPVGYKEIMSRIQKNSRNLSDEQRIYIHSILYSMSDSTPLENKLLSQVAKTFSLDEDSSSENVLIKNLKTLLNVNIRKEVDLGDVPLDEIERQSRELELQSAAFSSLELIVKLYEDGVYNIERQLSERINQVTSQIEFDKQLILDEFKDVVNDVIVESERAMLGRLVSSDLTRKDVWDKFGKEQSSLILESRLNKANQKISSIISKREQDIKKLTQDMSDITVAFNNTIYGYQTLKLIPSTSTMFNFQMKADRLTDNITDVAFFGGTLASLGLATGVVQIGTLAALFSTPIGLGVLGITGAATLYRFIVRSDENAFLQLNNVSKQLEKQLCSKLDEKMKKIEEEFSGMVDRLNSFSNQDVSSYLKQHHLQILYIEYANKAREKTIENSDFLLKQRAELLSLTK